MDVGTQKKNIPLYILEILKQYSDEEHRSSQKEIIDKLKFIDNAVTQNVFYTD